MTEEVVKNEKKDEVSINVAEMLGHKDLEIARLTIIIQKEKEKNKMLEQMINEMKGKS